MEKVKEELKCNKKGITLISLVVTIVVLLILARSKYIGTSGGKWYFKTGF